MEQNVHMITTYHTDNIENVACTKWEKIKLICLLDYNTSRVDLKEPLLVTFTIKQKQVNKSYKMRF
jgi:hypothetical protein